MESWLRALLSLAPSSIQSFATGVRDRILALYSWVNKVLVGAFAGWVRFATALGHARNWITWAIGEGYLTMRWIATIRVPALIRFAVEAAIRGLVFAINAAEARAKALVTALTRLTNAAVASLTKTIADLRSWAVRKTNEIIATLIVVRDLVMTLLTSPTRLASWLAAAMTRELWLYADRNADKIFAWAQRRSLAYTVSAVKRIEQILGRIL